MLAQESSSMYNDEVACCGVLYVATSRTWRFSSAPQLCSLGELRECGSSGDKRSVQFIVYSFICVYAAPEVSERPGSQRLEHREPFCHILCKCAPTPKLPKSRSISGSNSVNVSLPHFSFLWLRCDTLRSQRGLIYSLGHPTDRGTFLSILPRKKT